MSEPASREPSTPDVEASDYDGELASDAGSLTDLELGTDGRKYPNDS